MTVPLDKRREMLRVSAAAQRLKLSDLRPGDVVQGFEHWGCVPEFAHRKVRRTDAGLLYVRCAQGVHALDGHMDDSGVLAGMSAVTKKASDRCDDCPPEGYPTDKTRCASCPWRVWGEAA